MKRLLAGLQKAEGVGTVDVYCGVQVYFPSAL